MSIRIIQGDVHEELPKLPADSFDCIVTSPPYYGLRDYGTATWEGGDPTCTHVCNSQVPDTIAPRAISSGVRPGCDPSKCRKCGARRIDAQIGLEPTLDAYLETMVEVCRELRRVLKPSGVFFLNIGDSYAGHNAPAYRPGNETKNGGNSNKNGIGYVAGLKPKDLCLVPERLGIALQADGWWVRKRIVWAKPNPMPESCIDRPTSAHEIVWMLTKSAQYFWDQEAVREPHSRDWWNEKPCATGNPDRNDGGGRQASNETNGRNIRDVWTIPSHPFPGAHFATFPPALVERCIKAGSSEKGCCPRCGKPWVRIMEKIARVDWFQGKTDEVRFNSGKTRNALGGQKEFESYVRGACLGWQPSCDCRISGLIDCMPYTPIRSHILDPFAGSGTVGLVADRLGRDATLIDLNTSYIDMAVNRIRDDSPLFAKVATE